MGKVKEAAKGLPKQQEQQIQRAAASAYKSLSRSSIAYTDGMDSRWFDPSFVGYGEARVLRLGRGETELLGRRAIVSFEQASTRGMYSDGSIRILDRKLERAALGIELKPQGNEPTEAAFNFMRNPVHEMIRFAGALPFAPEAPLEERLDMATGILEQAVAAIA